jgi:hypothetical protein
MLTHSLACSPRSFKGKILTRPKKKFISEMLHKKLLASNSICHFSLIGPDLISVASFQTAPPTSIHKSAVEKRALGN